MKIPRIARLLLGLTLAANGVAMLAAPALWYVSIPGVTETGPLNLHFVRDIGCAYLVSGGALLWMWGDARAWPAAFAGSTFLVLHACVHAGEALAAPTGAGHLVRDLGDVFLPAVLALWLAWPRRNSFSSEENVSATMDHTAPARRL